MSELGTYTFLPWLRQGIATEITRVDGTSGSIARAQIVVGVDIAAGGATRTTEVTLDLHGPGEIIGFDPRMIVRLDPRAGVQDAEPNYFPAVEFHEPDFPWRYTPARASSENGCGRGWCWSSSTLPTSKRSGPQPRTVTSRSSPSIRRACCPTWRNRGRGRTRKSRGSWPANPCRRCSIASRSARYRGCCVR